MSRGRGGFSRDESYSISESQPSWSDDYLNAVRKYSVKSRTEDSAIFDQINQIIGNSKSKYSSVEEAVLDMQKRTGLLDLLQKQAAAEPALFSKIPGLKTFIDNHVKDYPSSSVDSVIFNLMRIPTFKSELPSGEDVDDDVRQYINACIADRSPEDNCDDSSGQMGKADVEIDSETTKNNNPLQSLSPATF